MLDQITALLNETLTRVENLISLYGPEVAGRRTVEDTDVLRGALVLLHAGMEEYLRSLMIWKIATYDRETLDNYGFANGTKRPPAKISLGELASHRGKSVDDLIAGAVRSHLEDFQSFNDLGEVKKSLRQCGISQDQLDANNFGSIPELIKRRHNIVHRADRNDVQGGQGNHSTKSLRKATLESYLAAVRALSAFVSANL